MRKITVFIPITIPSKYSANVTPSIKVLKTLNIEPIYPERLSNESLTALHDGGDEPIDLGIYNTNHDYGCLIQKLQEVSKLIHAVHILDLTHGLTLPQFINNPFCSICGNPLPLGGGRSIVSLRSSTLVFNVFLYGS